MTETWRDRHPELRTYVPSGARTVRIHPRGRQIAQYASDPAFTGWWLDRTGKRLSIATLSDFLAAGFTPQAQWARASKQETAA